MTISGSVQIGLIIPYVRDNDHGHFILWSTEWYGIIIHQFIYFNDDMIGLSITRGYEANEPMSLIQKKILYATIN